MISQINFTFGSSQLLRDIAKKHPDRTFKLCVSNGDNVKYALFDVSGKENIFSSPISLKTIDGFGDDLRGIISYQSFKLSNDDERIMREKAKDIIASSKQAKGANAILLCNRVGHPNSTILLSAWNSQADLNAWHDSNLYSSLNEFSARGPQNTYFSETYSLAD
ncbi:hypothetical protein [Limosilactobacillus sp.]|uniref:hypothetical protein n=1 Tax=Limosilactobacillus sp. TaxID=2773925 RepID=UPI00345E1E1F